MHVWKMSELPLLSLLLVPQLGAYWNIPAVCRDVVMTGPIHLDPQRVDSRLPPQKLDTVGGNVCDLSEN
jgi:hypothetical protein